jgi:cytochrome c-type biogenesis protein CcmH
MRFRGCVLPSVVLALLAGSAGAIDPSEHMEDPEQQAFYETITAEVRCLVCQNQTIANSTAPLAADLRREIRRMIAGGQSESEIKDFLVARYGDFILYKPRFQSWTLLLWVGPFVFLLVGALTLMRVVAKRAVLPIDEDAE